MDEAGFRGGAFGFRRLLLWDNGWNLRSRGIVGLGVSDLLEIRFIGYWWWIWTRCLI
jgi:hypothetical protein